MNRTTVTDIKTKENYEFNTIKEASDFISKVLNKDVNPSVIRFSALRSTVPYFDRFIVKIDTKNKFINPKKDKGNKYRRIRQWNLDQFEKSYEVISGHKVIRIYDEDFFKKMEKFVHSRFKNSDFTFKKSESEGGSRTSETLASLRIKTRIYIFIKLDKSLNFREKIKVISPLLDELDNMIDNYEVQ